MRATASDEVLEPGLEASADSEICDEGLELPRVLHPHLHVLVDDVADEGVSLEAVVMEGRRLRRRQKLRRLASLD